MLYWSKKNDALGECESVTSEQCIVCSEKNKPLCKMERFYFLLYGLPLAPLSVNIYKICFCCNHKLKLRNNDPNYSMIVGTISAPQKLKYYWGWFILIPVFLFMTWLLLKFK